VATLFVVDVDAGCSGGVGVVCSILYCASFSGNLFLNMDKISVSDLPTNCLAIWARLGRLIYSLKVIDVLIGNL